MNAKTLQCSLNVMQTWKHTFIQYPEVFATHSESINFTLPNICSFDKQAAFAFSQMVIREVVTVYKWTDSTVVIAHL